MLYITTSTDPTYNANNAQPMVMHRNLLAEGTLASSTLPTTAPRANAVNESTFDYWQPTAAPDTLRVTYGSAQAADGAFFVNHTLGTAGATLTVQYYDGAAWQTQATLSPTSNDPFGFIWPSRSATGWGIQISGAVAQVGVAWIGPRVVIPGGVVPGYSPIWASREITKYSGVSRRGQWFGQRIERAGAKLSASFMPLDYSFALTTLSTFRTRYNNGNAFIWASAPSMFPEDVGYCWAPDGAVFRPTVLAGGSLVNLSLDFEAYCEA